jgi:exonuclease VII small subunit
MAKRKPTFEEALEELEKIGKYERGMALVKQCREILSKAEHKIQQLQQRADGTLATTPFERPNEQEDRA